MTVNSAAVLGSITPASGERLTLVIDPDTALEEIVYAVFPSAPSSTTLTIIRGVDGTGVEGVSGVAHSAGAKVRHMAIGVDFREANNHIEQTTGTAHGLVLGNVTLSSGTGNVSTQMLASNAVTTVKITDANVTTAKIADANVTTAKILDANVTTAKIADLNVTTGKLADSAVTSAKIADLTIATGDIADSAITSAKIADGTIVAGDIADGAVTSAKILNDTIVNADINSAAAIAYSKLNLAGSITSSDITDGTIVNADVNASAAIAYSKLALAGTITSSDITNDTIVDGDINTAANIAWTKIAPSSTVSATELGYLDGVTSAIQTQIDTKLATTTAASTYAPLASPALTGTPTAPTATAGTNTTQVATTAYVGTAISNLVAGAPTTLDTLDEIAAAIADTGNFSDTVVLKSGSTMSGNLAMGTNKITGLGTPTAGTDATTKNYVDGVLVAPSNLTGPITSVGSATSIASQTGTGTKFVMDTSPTLVTPALGVATATSVNGTTIPSTKTLVVTTDKLSALAATTSAELAGVISDETGTGALVFANTPTLVTPVLGNATASSLAVTGTTTPVNGINLPAANILQISTNSTRAITVNATQQVGIGMTPAVTLDITGTNVRLTPTNVVTNGYIFNGSSSNALWATMQSYKTTIDGVTRFEALGSGSVGIGAAAGTPQLLVTNVGANSANPATVIKGAASQSGDLLQVQNSAATVLVEVDSAGNVGIGTTTPATYGLLAVATTAGSTPKMISMLNNRSYVAGDTSGVMIAGLAGNGTVNSHDYGSIVMSANSALGSGDGAGAIASFFAGGQSSSKLSTLKYLEATASGGGGLETVALWTAGVSRLHINSAGNIGVGTTTPTAKLDVNGSIKSDNLSSVNAVLNSSFNVWQRGTSVAASNQSLYTADRWMVATAASMSVTISRQATGDTTNLPNIQYCARVQRNNGQTATGNWNIQQSMESINSIPFAGKTVTLSFYARKGANFSAASDLLVVGFYSGTGTDQNFQNGYTGTVNVVNTTQAITSTWVRYTFTGSVPSTSTELALVLGYTATGTAGASDFFEITGVQVELGSVATPYRSNQPTYQAELAACQRYYEKSYDQTIAAGANSTGGSIYITQTSDGSNNSAFSLRFKVEKRHSSWSAAYYTTAGTVGNWQYSRNGVGTTDVAVVTDLQATTGARVYMNVGAAWTANTISGHWVVSNEL
jgi:hypothetical protein